LRPQCEAATCARFLTETKLQKLVCLRMDKRAMVLEHLEKAKRHVAEGKQIILEQEKILADLIAI